jgi:plasmid stabilization system protein ParE
VKVVRLSAEATDELADAAAWYRERRAGLELEFLAEVEQVLPLVARAPASFPSLLNIPGDLEVRRALLPRFPYAVIFFELESEIRVLAVAHVKRRPGYWLNRVIDQS